MVKILEPFESITRRLSGSSYPTLNLVHPYMCMLKRMFAPRADENETIDSYLDLVCGPTSEDVDDNNLSDSDSDDDFPTAGNRQHWQHSYRQFREQMQNQRGRGQEHRHSRSRSRSRSRIHTSHAESNENSQAGYPEILKRVRATIYLSLDKLWDVPTELCLVASILDPRIKSFLFVEESDRHNQKELAKSFLKNLYDQLKEDLTLPEEIAETPVLIDDDDIFADMWSSNELLVPIENDEILYRNPVFCH